MTNDAEDQWTRDDPVDRGWYRIRSRALNETIEVAEFDGEKIVRNGILARVPWDTMRAKNWERSRETVPKPS